MILSISNLEVLTIKKRRCVKIEMLKNNNAFIDINFHLKMSLKLLILKFGTHRVVLFNIAFNFLYHVLMFSLILGVDD